MSTFLTLLALYFFYFLLLFLVININSYTFKTQTNITRIFYIALTIIASARWNTGSDWESYLLFYDECKLTGICPSYFEPAYSFINQIAVDLGLSYSFVLLFSAIISNLAYYKFTVNMHIPLQGLLALYTYGLANLIIIRSTIAQSIGLYALSYNFYGFVFIIFIASTFHYSSIFALTYFYIRRLNLITLSILFLLAFFLIINLENFIQYYSYMQNIEFIRSKVITYFNNDVFEPKSISVISFIQKSVIIYIILKYRKYVDKKFNGLSNLALFGILLGFFLSFYSTVLLRFAGYFEPFIYIYICILFSSSLYFFKSKLLSLICFLLLFTKFTFIIYTNFDLIIPYEFFFQDNFKNVY